MAESNSVNGTRNGGHRLQRRQAPGRRAGPPRQNNGGNARRNYERYLALARDAALNGDKIEMENCYQHAEHYFRVLNNRE